jgi:carbonic anhydrase/acetyltransferase-like protein (isoleucine patch superfamily)
VVVSGNCDIGEKCFLGVNATLRDNIKLERFVVIGSGAIVMKSCPERTLVKPAVSTYSIEDRDLI